MNIKLLKIRGENFKGLKSFEMVIDGDNAVIQAENGVGKTTVYDMFLWALFDKDSTGRKSFEIRPLDANEQPLKGLVTLVILELSIDGVNHVFRKELHENVVKDQLRGYKTLCYIDEVPKKVGEYGDYIAEIIAEDTFKLLTDLNFFNGKMHWKERREVLLSIAGEIGTPKGFEELIAALNGRSIDEFKKVLSEQKKRLVKERDEINPRIDEIQRGLDEYVNFAADDLQAKRDGIKTEIAELDGKRNNLFAKEKERQAQLDKINELKSKKIQREAGLANDTTGIKDLLDKKAKIETGVAGCRQEVVNIEAAIKAKETSIKNDQTAMNLCTGRLDEVRDEYTKASEAPIDDSCYTCGQKLPQDKVAEIEDKRKAKLAEITKRGNEIKADVEVCKNAIAETEKQIAELREQLDKANIKLKEGEEYKTAQFEKIEAQISNNKTTPPEKDLTWQQIVKDIDIAEATIGEPASEQLEKIEAERTAKSNELTEINNSLAQADRMKKDTARIEELKDKEKQLAQQIADVEKQLADIEQYQATESEMIEQAVNGKFKHVNFRLFSELLNGSLEECCEATFNGVPYADMSTGQKIYCGIDIINVLSEHYDISVPLFIDHAESLTLPIEANSQTVQLYAKPKVKKLSVERKGELVNV